ncbi:SNF2 family N-terminal domain-containing protein [Chytridium lagenaria]|nr:SNF2 family N-terminal domain-containing protein [Chytridium lagenaria]
MYSTSNKLQISLNSYRTITMLEGSQVQTTVEAPTESMDTTDQLTGAEDDLVGLELPFLNESEVGIENDGAESDLELDVSVITEQMKLEERRIEEEHEEEYQKKLKADANKEFDEHIAEQRKTRLNTLLTRAGFYSKWLGSRLESRQKEQAESGRNTPVEDVEALTPNTDITVNSRKRKASPKKSSGASAKKSKKDELFIDEEVVTSNKEKPTSSLEGRSQRQPSLITGCFMREYQIVGMEWLISLWEQGLNGILADEMGLGKTLQTIAFLAHLTEMKVWGPYLIISPLSTLSNWVAEVHRFAPSLNVLLYHGTGADRKDLRKNHMSTLNKDFPIIVTSFEIAMRDRKYLQKINWKYIIIDEGHRLKNFNCKLLRELKTYPCANRLILSGTPLQNNLAELWSMLNFLMPDIFQDLKDFEGWFDFEDLNDGNDKKFLDKQASDSVVTNLHQILKPFLLRRVKTEVEIDLPKKKEFLLFAPLVPRQKELYDACVKGMGKLREFLIKEIGDKKAAYAKVNGTGSLNDINAPEEAKNEVEEAVGSRRKSRRNLNTDISYKENISDDQFIENMERKVEREEQKKNEPSDGKSIQKEAARIVGGQSLQNVLMQLRKICNHPYLFNVDIEEPLENSRRATAAQASKGRKGKGRRENEVAVRLPDIVACSGKMLMLERLLPRLFKEGHKVLIFSQMTRMLDVLAEWFETVKMWKYCRIDGSVPLEIRRQQITDFNSSSDCNVFLLSTRAGGLGINLTAADTVIIFDSDWNPQVDLQAQDRVHRIGQTRPVINL